MCERLAALSRERQRARRAPPACAASAATGGSRAGRRRPTRRGPCAAPEPGRAPSRPGRSAGSARSRGRTARAPRRSPGGRDARATDRAPRSTDTGSSDCASSISSSASSRRPIGTRHDIAYQWCAVAYAGSRLIDELELAIRAAASPNPASTSRARATCALRPISGRASRPIAALDAALVHTFAGAQDAVVRQQAVGVGEAAVRQGILRCPRRSRARRSRPPSAAPRRCAGSGDSAPADTDCAPPGCPPDAGFRLPGRAGPDAARASWRPPARPPPAPAKSQAVESSVSDHR